MSGWRCTCHSVQPSLQEVEFLSSSIGKLNTLHCFYFCINNSFVRFVVSLQNETKENFIWTKLRRLEIITQKKFNGF